MLHTDASSFNPHSDLVKWECYCLHVADGETAAQNMGAAAHGHTAGIMHRAVGS